MNDPSNQHKIPFTENIHQRSSCVTTPLAPNASFTSPLTIVSLGYRCSTAGILKRLGLKHESYPFDWMISRLPILQHCIETKFKYFMEPTYYTKERTHTTHYHEGTNPVPMKICDETIYANHYYETHDTIRKKTTTRIPAPLSTVNRDTYAYQMAFNHRNISETDTQEYYKRCIARFTDIWENPVPVIGMYIHPTITETEYKDQRDLLCAEYTQFYNDVMPENWSGIFFIMVRTTYPYPITAHKQPVIEKLVDHTQQNKPQENHEKRSRYIEIYVVYTNRDFIDAGEIFMQNAYIETDKMCELIQTKISQT